MIAKRERLTVLSDAEQEARDGLPDLTMPSGWSIWLYPKRIGVRGQPSRSACPDLLRLADRLLQGQTRFLPLRLE